MSQYASSKMYPRLRSCLNITKTTRLAEKLYCIENVCYLSLERMLENFLSLLYVNT
jgi:hypothetical protein